MKDINNKSWVIFRMCCIIGLSIMLFFGLNACWKGRTFEEVFKLNWGIDLPDNMTQEFHINNVAGLAGQGDGTKYTVFKLEAEPTDFIADFSREKDEQIENRVNNLISWAKFEISEKFLPDWGAEYYWRHTGKFYDAEWGSYMDNLYMIYFRDSLKLICCERMI